MRGTRHRCLDRLLAAASERATLRRAVNATGVLLHTNLGRATLAPAAVNGVADVAAGHASLEVDEETGGRGNRQAHAIALLCELTGAEDAFVVNNNAAATYLAIAALAAGREVILSRGQMVEIGGQFRLPDVIAAAGARLVEVGTTNRTRIADYERDLKEAKKKWPVINAEREEEGLPPLATLREYLQWSKETGEWWWPVPAE